MAEKTVFVLTPFTREFADVYDAIKAAAKRAEQFSHATHRVFRGNDVWSQSDVLANIKKHLSNSDLIIADITDSNATVLFELGYAEASRRPIIMINQRDHSIPFNVFDRRIRLYDRHELHQDLVPHLADDIAIATTDPDAFIGDREKKGNDIPAAFVSYSHADADCLTRLQVHLRPLVKKGRIHLWEDTMIKAGDKWKETIESALHEAAIAVLLISADFLASDFIVDNELPPILEGADAKGTRILPVILRPCRFERDEYLSRFQAINSPDNPLLLMEKNEQERTWDKLARQIELELESRSS